MKMPMPLQAKHSSNTCFLFRSIILFYNCLYSLKLELSLIALSIPLIPALSQEIRILWIYKNFEKGT